MWFQFSFLVYTKVCVCVCLNCLTPPDPFFIMDIDDSPHQVTSSLSPLPEDVQSLPCIFLWPNNKSYILEMFLVKTNVCTLLLYLSNFTLGCSKTQNKHKKSLISGEAEGGNTSNTDSPDSLLRAANSRIIVPAHAVQVSDSVPVRESGFRTPYRRFTWKTKKFKLIFTSLSLKYFLVTY